VTKNKEAARGGEFKIGKELFHLSGKPGERQSENSAPATGIRGEKDTPMSKKRKEAQIGRGLSLSLLKETHIAHLMGHHEFETGTENR